MIGKKIDISLSVCVGLSRRLGRALSSSFSYQGD